MKPQHGRGIERAHEPATHKSQVVQQTLALEFRLGEVRINIACKPDLGPACRAETAWHRHCADVLFQHTKLGKNILYAAIG